MLNVSSLHVYCIIWELIFLIGPHSDKRCARLTIKLSSTFPSPAFQFSLHSQRLHRLHEGGDESWLLLRPKLCCSANCSKNLINECWWDLSRFSHLHRGPLKLSGSCLHPDYAPSGGVPQLRGLANGRINFLFTAEEKWSPNIDLFYFLLEIWWQLFFRHSSIQVSTTSVKAPLVNV